MFVSIDSQEVAVHLAEPTELATGDKSNFVRNGWESLILGVTALDEIIGLSV